MPDDLHVPVIKMLSSPVEDVLKGILFVDKQSAKAVYLQLAERIAAAIHGQLILSGSALPGTRQLAVLLKLHRKTIVAAYEELSVQGFVTLIPNKGTFVNQDIPSNTMQNMVESGGTILPKNTILTIPNNRVLELEKNNPIGDWILDDGKPDFRLLTAEKLGVGFSSLLQKPYSDVSSFLKHKLVQYLEIEQHIIVADDQLMTTQNRAMSIVLIAQALLQLDDIVVVGAPGNYTINMTMQQVGAKLHSIPMEEDGLDLNALEDFCKKQTIKMVYISPQHHYPTTTILSHIKRMELLRLAAQYQFWILEDETDGLYDFQKRKLSSLAALDTEGIVVQVHSFEQMIRPDWNVSFIVASKTILKEIQKYKSYLGLLNGGLHENIMASMLQSGVLQRLMKRTTKIYQQRRNLFCELINQHWRTHVHYEVPKNGLGLWLEFEWNYNLSAFAKKCRSNGLEVPHHLLYQSRKWTAMRFGFGQWGEPEMEAITMIIKQLL